MWPIPPDYLFPPRLLMPSVLARAKHSEEWSYRTEGHRGTRKASVQPEPVDFPAHRAQPPPGSPIKRRLIDSDW